MTLGLEKTRELRRAYYAAVSFVDSELGRVIDEVVTLMVAVMMMMMVTQHIPTMTKSHHGGKMSVMMKVGMCQCQKPTIHHTL